MPVIDHCRAFLKCLQHQVEWTTKRGDETQVTFLKAFHLCGDSRRWLQITFACVRCRHDTAENVVWHVTARVVEAADCLGHVVSGEESQQVADQKDGIVSKAV